MAPIDAEARDTEESGALCHRDLATTQPRGPSLQETGPSQAPILMGGSGPARRHTQGVAHRDDPLPRHQKVGTVGGVGLHKAQCALK